jgi:hypothetical protein
VVSVEFLAAISTIVSCVVVVIGAFAALRQLRHLRASNEVAAMENIFNRYESPAVMESILFANRDLGTFPPTGVNAQLVRNVRDALDAEGFTDVKIVVSGGFDAERISRFEQTGVPTDAYAVGSAFFKAAGQFDFTADIVAIDNGEGWRECHKVGRPERPNPRLSPVE